MPETTPRYRRRLTEAEILEAVKTVFGIAPRWHSYVAVPNRNIVTTYLETGITFSGADFRAMYKDYTLNVFIYYKNDITAAERKLEKDFEAAVAEMGEFTKEHDYFSEYKSYVTQYKFQISEHMEE